MATIYLSQHATLKSYKANVNGEKATIDIRIEVMEHRELGFMLRELKELQDEQRAAAKLAPAGKRTKPVKALPAPFLQIPHFSGDET